MPDVAVRRFSALRSALVAFFVLTVSAALGGAPAYGLPTGTDSSALFEVAAKVIVEEDDTYTVKVVVTDNTSVGFLTESDCDGDSFNGNKLGSKATATFRNNGDSRTCTIEGSDNIKNSNGQITHTGDEYIVKVGDSTEPSSSPQSDQVKLSQSVTFPGKVTEADGGEVNGNKVTFDNMDPHEVKGKASSASAGSTQDSEGESGSIPMWVWVLVGVLAVVIVGGIVAAVVMNQRKKNQGQFVPYAAPAQGYDPNQALFGQPGQMQQPYQPGYSEPATQPYQQPYNNQPGQPGQPTHQPYQPAYTEPATQPYQQPYNNQPGQPGQPTHQPYQPAYTEPATQPYQQPYNNQPGQPGQGH